MQVPLPGTATVTPPCDAAVVPSLFRSDLPRWRHLVQPAWLAMLLEGRPVAAAPPGDWCLFEVGCDAPDAFAQGHIPGAGYLDSNWLEQEPFWNKVPDAELLRLLPGLGITRDTTVLLYGRHTTAAARAAHLMLYAGVEDVRLLDGGLAAWIGDGLPVAPGSGTLPTPRADFGCPVPACPHYLSSTAQVKARLRRSDTVLASIRTWDEFTGKTSGYGYIAARGEIPGAAWGRAGEDDDMNSMRAYQQADGRMKPASEIRGFWRNAGIVPDKRIVFYCGTGWRASLAFFYAWLMGWEHISVYDGGWFEWSSDPDNPRTFYSATTRSTSSP